MIAKLKRVIFDFLDSVGFWTVKLGILTWNPSKPNFIDPKFDPLKILSFVSLQPVCELSHLFLGDQLLIDTLLERSAFMPSMINGM